MSKPIDNFQEIGELKNIASSSALRGIFLKHKEYLQQQVNTCIRQQKFTEAYGELAKLDDIEKIIELIGKRVKYLEGK